MKNFLTEFNRIKDSIEKGTTPVYSEVRGAKTSLLELVPYLIISSTLLIISTLLINKLNVNDLFKIVIVLIINTTTNTITSCLMVLLKHNIRKRILKKYGIEITEKNIAVLECMEYQSV